MKITDEQKKLAESNKEIVNAWTRIFSKREEYAYFRLRSTEAADQMISDLVGKTTTTYVTRLHKNAEEMRMKLRQLRDIISLETVTEDVPRPLICARVIMQDWIVAIMEVGLHEYSLGEIGMSTFIFWYDVAEGLAHTIGGISMALEAEKESTYRILKFISEQKRENRGTISKHQQKIDVSRWRAEAARAAQLLHDDPSGFTLIDEAVAEIKAEVSGRPFHTDLLSIEPFQIPEFVIAGAQTAQTLYKTLYPLTENL
jgi:hypothetical protein